MTQKVAAVDSLPQMYTQEDITKILRVDEKTLRRLVRAGEVPKPRKFGRLLRWNAEQFDQWLNTGPQTSA